jgi:hypothetical protein
MRAYIMCAHNKDDQRKKHPNAEHAQVTKARKRVLIATDVRADGADNSHVRAKHTNMSKKIAFLCKIMCQRKLLGVPSTNPQVSAQLAPQLE